ncbi:MAG TPA: hypothetical protein VFD78_05655 [Chitinophagaceae bacterium]|nr:hypothetical protein [Chitinophagaceae bacterium]
MEKSLLTYTFGFSTQDKTLSMWNYLPQQLSIEFEAEIKQLKLIQLSPPEHLINRILARIQNENANFVKK